MDVTRLNTFGSVPSSVLTARCVKLATAPPAPQSPGESPRRAGGPPLSVGSVGRAEPLPRVLCKGEGLPRERSSARNGVAIIPRCIVWTRDDVIGAETAKP